MASICRRLIKLFVNSTLAVNSTQDTPDVELAKRAIAGEVNQALREKLERLRKEYPKLSFNALWERLKAQESDLFAQARRIEENHWGVSKGGRGGKGFVIESAIGRLHFGACRGHTAARADRSGVAVGRNQSVRPTWARQTSHALKERKRIARMLE
jgi:hypothetical protein